MTARAGAARRRPSHLAGPAVLSWNQSWLFTAGFISSKIFGGYVMQKKLTALLPYVVILGLDFYLLPLLAGDTGPAMLLMLCVMPLAALISALVCGMRTGFGLILPAAALLLFIPTIFIYYNSSAWIYAPVYAAVVLIGTGIGGAFHRKA